MADQALVVWTTLPDQAQAESLAATLVREQLAACGQVMPAMTSFYLWEGTLHRDQEWLVVLKSRGLCYPALESRIRALHPYEVPEILAIPVTAGLPAYLAWLFQNVPVTT